MLAVHVLFHWLQASPGSYMSFASLCVQLGNVLCPHTYVFKTNGFTSGFPILLSQETACSMPRLHEKLEDVGQS